MPDPFFQWIDLIWLPIFWFVVHKLHRVKAIIFVIASILTLRTQVELMEVIGFETGILKILDGPVLFRGIITYSIVYVIYLALALVSPRTPKLVFMAASITIYIFAFILSMLVMLL